MTTTTKEPLRTDDGELACLECMGDCSVMSIENMADEEWHDCEDCDGRGYRLCEFCDEPAVEMVDDGGLGLPGCAACASRLRAEAAREESEAA